MLARDARSPEYIERKSFGQSTALEDANARLCSGFNVLKFSTESLWQLLWFVGWCSRWRPSYRRVYTCTPYVEGSCTYSVCNAGQ